MEVIKMHTRSKKIHLWRETKDGKNTKKMRKHKIYLYKA